MSAAIQRDDHVRVLVRPRLHEQRAFIEIAIERDGSIVRAVSLRPGESRAVAALLCAVADKIGGPA